MRISLSISIWRRGRPPDRQGQTARGQPPDRQGQYGIERLEYRGKGGKQGHREARQETWCDRERKDRGRPPGANRQTDRGRPPGANRQTDRGKTDTASERQTGASVRTPDRGKPCLYISSNHL